MNDACCFICRWTQGIGGTVVRRTNEGIDNIGEYEMFEGWKGPSITQLIMSIRSKDEERDMKRSRNRKVIRLEGSPSGL